MQRYGTDPSWLVLYDSAHRPSRRRAVAEGLVIHIMSRLTRAAAESIGEAAKSNNQDGKDGELSSAQFQIEASNQDAVRAVLGRPEFRRVLDGRNGGKRPWHVLLTSSMFRPPNFFQHFLTFQASEDIGSLSKALKTPFGNYERMNRGQTMDYAVPSGSRTLSDTFHTS